MTAKRWMTNRIVPRGRYECRVVAVDIRRSPTDGRRIFRYVLVISAGPYRGWRLRRYWIREYDIGPSDRLFFLGCGMPRELWELDRWPSDTVLTFDEQLPVGRTLEVQVATPQPSDERWRSCAVDFWRIEGPHADWPVTFVPAASL
jgi:hypothetical protein